QDGDIGAGRPPDHFEEVTRLTHIPGHDKKNCRQGRQGHIHRQRGQEQNDQHQGSPVDDARQGTGAPVADIGGGAGNGAGGGKATEQGGGDVGDTLPHQFLVGIVSGSGHAVGHHRRQQGLDGPQHGDGKGRADQLNHMLQTDIWHLESRQAPGYTAKGRAHGPHPLKGKQGLHQGRHHQGHQGSGHAPQTGDPHRIQHQCQGQQRQGSGGDMKLGQHLQQLPQLFVKVLAADGGQAKEVTPLADPDNDANTRGKAEDHRGGDKLYNCAQPRQTQQQQYNPCHHRRQLQTGKAVFGGYPRQDDNKCPRRPGDLQSAAAKGRHQQPRDYGGVDTLLRLGPGGDGEGHGQGQGNHSDDHPRDDVGQPVLVAQQSQTV